MTQAQASQRATTAPEDRAALIESLDDLQGELTLHGNETGLQWVADAAGLIGKAIAALAPHMAGREELPTDEYGDTAIDRLRDLVDNGTCNRELRADIRTLLALTLPVPSGDGVHPAPDVREDGYVMMPVELTETMQAVWQGEFHAQLRRRYKKRYKADQGLSAEAAAYAALTSQFALSTPTQALDAEVEGALAVPSGGGEQFWQQQLREYAAPDDADSVAVAAMKKAARVITQMHHEKAWISTDVQDVIEGLAAGIAALATPVSRSAVLDLLKAEKAKWFCSGPDCSDFDHGRDEGLQMAIDAVSRSLTNDDGGAE